MNLSNYSELVASWNKTLAVLAKLANVPVALAMKVDQGNIEVFSKNENSDNPYSIGEAESLIGSGLYCEHVIKTQHLLNVPNALNDSKWDDNPDLKLNMIAYLGMPILDFNNSPFGTICILDNQEHEFSSSTIELLEAVKISFETQLKVLQQQHIEDENLHNEELTRLVRGISHEINTPLGTSVTAASVIDSAVSDIKGNLENHSLSHRFLVAKLETMQKSVETLTKSLNQSANKVNTLQTLLIDEFIYSGEKINIVKTITSSLDKYQHKFENNGVVCHFDYDKTASFDCFLAASLLQEVLLILLNNSLEHGLHSINSPSISLHLQKHQNVAQLHYQDNGVGIDDKIEHNIFNPFFTTSRNTGNTGLGLSVLKRIVVLQLNGNIELIQSEKGVHFIISFPIFNTAEDLANKN